MSTDGDRKSEHQTPIDAVAAQFARGIALAGEAADQTFARQLIDQPPLPPDLVRTTKAAVRGQVTRRLGESADEAFLFGGPAALDGEGDCLLITYQELLAGGLSVCLDPASHDILAIWLIPEG